MVSLNGKPFAKCKYKKCPKFKECERPIATSAVIDFERICPKDNYKWYIAIEKKENA